MYLVVYDVGSLEWGVFIRRNGTVEWNDGMERWNGMEWNDHAYIIVYFRNGRLPRCAHAQQIDLLLAACHTKKDSDEGSTDGEAERRQFVCACVAAVWSYGML